mmetsp:Transcript_35919/g.66172  ORF Transcript_35919/g.66172 Transcript_35919/m.66172 type:complete len:103 (-) Transcript_35919:41-349(-)
MCHHCWLMCHHCWCYFLFQTFTAPAAGSNDVILQANFCGNPPIESPFSTPTLAPIDPKDVSTYAVYIYLFSLSCFLTFILSMCVSSFFTHTDRCECIYTLAL